MRSFRRRNFGMIRGRVRLWCIYNANNNKNWTICELLHLLKGFRLGASIQLPEIECLYEEDAKIEHTEAVIFSKCPIPDKNCGRESKSPSLRMPSLRMPSLRSQSLSIHFGPLIKATRQPVWKVDFEVWKLGQNERPGPNRSLTSASRRRRMQLAVIA